VPSASARFDLGGDMAPLSAALFICVVGVVLVSLAVYAFGLIANAHRG
jgi:hypothetical protein